VSRFAGHSQDLPRHCGASERQQSVFIPAGDGYIRAIGKAELIYEKVKALPEPLQTEALHCVDYLLAHREDGDQEAADRARFSAQNLARAYGENEPEQTEVGLRR
jgi:hypothetical protein